jgi:hypothetical protein
MRALSGLDSPHGGRSERATAERLGGGGGPSSGTPSLCACWGRGLSHRADLPVRTGVVGGRARLRRSARSAVRADEGAEGKPGGRDAIRQRCDLTDDEPSPPAARLVLGRGALGSCCASSPWMDRASAFLEEYQNTRGHLRSAALRADPSLGNCVAPQRRRLRVGALSAAQRSQLKRRSPRVRPGGDRKQMT